jgi:hypothetical protein
MPARASPYTPVLVMCAWAGEIEECNGPGARLTPLVPMVHFRFLPPSFSGLPPFACLVDSGLARRHNLLVLSDDVYQLLPFPGRRPPPRLVTYDMQMGAGNGGKW